MGAEPQKLRLLVRILGRDLKVDNEPIFKLVVSRGLAKGKEFLIEDGENLIGRWDPEQGAFPEIDLEDYDEEAKVSRKHAMLYKNGGELLLEDIGSLNGTYLNRGERLQEGEKHPLKVSDELIVGKTFLKLVVEL